MRIERYLGELAAAHRLMNHQGSCELLHGHNWGVTVFVEAPVDEKTGIAVDFLAFDAFKKDLWNDLDHGMWLHQDDSLIKVLKAGEVHMKLLEVPGEPTAENVASIIVRRLHLAFPQAIRCGVRLSESSDCIAEVTLQETPPAAEA